MKSNDHFFERDVSTTAAIRVNAQRADEFEHVTTATKGSGAAVDVSDASPLALPCFAQGAPYGPFRFRISVRPGRNPRFTWRFLRKAKSVFCYHERLSNE